jgi:hypothetical protein
LLPALFFLSKSQLPWIIPAMAGQFWRLCPQPDIDCWKVQTIFALMPQTANDGHGPGHGNALKKQAVFVKSLG